MPETTHPTPRETGSDGLSDDPQLVRDPWRVLLVDDRPERRTIMRIVLGSIPPPGKTEIVVVEASTVSTAVAQVAHQPVDTAIVEVQMPTDVGANAIEALRAADPSMIIIACSFQVDRATRLQASEAGADAFIAKPVNRRDLLEACWTSHGRAQSPLPAPSP
jgi:DNA-binding NarL/FixJ family response regulator